ncbi:replication initiation protein [Clostridium sp. YIM B02515]|uniref:Replication initiation protein n=1 Tax=Clostridium rhizosphaerae TaxID=2803861 RepID=A0ABS1TEF5_9CLOT|nr:replication initiation protein [Clostridium rhizosphaerae]MBL4937742.1 replication initiation protein [Clostridium rhizosphaerae]
MLTDLTNSKNNWIYQSNKLLESSYTLTVLEQKILRILASMIKKDDVDFKEYEFKASDLAKIMGSKNNKNIYRELDKLTDILMTRVVRIKNMDNNNFEKYHFVEVVKYSDGILKLKINPEMKPFYINLDWYTKYQLKNILQFKSTYSFRFYELLKQYQTIGSRSISIEDIRLKLDIKKDEYPKYANLKQKVIIPAQKEINEKSDISFEFHEIKESRKVVAINFKITNTKIEQELLITSDTRPDSNRDKIQEVKSIIIEDITELEVSSILNAAKGDVDIIREKYEIAKVSDRIKNIVSWMLTAIKEDYQWPKGKKKASTFNNFEQRKYDFDSLEKKLLGWEEAAE